MPTLTEILTQTLIRRERYERGVESVSNVYYFGRKWETDVLSLEKSGYLTDHELKISRADFLADFRKPRHAAMKARKAGKGRRACPNRFYFVTAPGIVTAKDIPPHAGWMVVQGNRVEIRKRAPLLHKGKHDKAKFYRKAYYKLTRISKV